MKRFFTFTLVFAVVAGAAVLATDDSANAAIKSHGRPGQSGNGTGSGPRQPTNTTSNGTSIFGGSAHTPPTNTIPPVWKKFPPNSIGTVFGNPKPTNNLPPVWKKLPPGSIWKVYGNLNPTSNPKQPPPKGTGKGHGSGFGLGFGGGTVVTTAPVIDQATTVPAAEAATDEATALRIAAGSTFTLKGENFGIQAGRVGMTVGQLLIPVEVTSWSNTAITITLPEIGVGSAAKAQFVVQRTDGSTANKTNFEMVAAK